MHKTADSEKLAEQDMIRNRVLGYTSERESGEQGSAVTVSLDKVRSSCCLVGLLKPAALLIAPRIAFGDVTFTLAVLLFFEGPSNLGFPKPVILLLLEAPLPLCELTELTLLLEVPPNP